MTTCGRCSRRIREDDAQTCWLCEDDLCPACWEVYGHCGHKEAAEANRVLHYMPGEDAKRHFILTMVNGRN